MSTEMNVDIHEFDLYEYKSPEEVEELVFCLKV
jgi:hypothetical protein